MASGLRSRGPSSFCHFCCWKRVCAHGQTARGLPEAEGTDIAIRGDKESLVSFGNLIGATARHRNRVGQEQCKRNAKAAVECRESCPSTSRMRNSFGTFEHRAACVQGARPATLTRNH